MLEYFSNLVQPLKPTKLARNLAAGARWRSHLPSAFSQARNTNRRAGLVNGENRAKRRETFFSCPKVCHDFVLQMSVSGGPEGVSHYLLPSKAIS